MLLSFFLLSWQILWELIPNPNTCSAVSIRRFCSRCNTNKTFCMCNKWTWSQMRDAKSQRLYLKDTHASPSLFHFSFLVISHMIHHRFANEMVYVGLSYYGPVLGSDHYISFLLSSLVEIPSYLICWVVMDRWGRRWPLCVCMILSGVSCIITVLLSEGNQYFG
jgi:hypothetical protein